MTLRRALAAVLAVGLGALFVVYPEALVRVHTVGRVPHDRGGSYGEDKSIRGGWRRAIQGLGVVSIGLGLFFAYPVLV